MQNAHLTESNASGHSVAAGNAAHAVWRSARIASSDATGVEQGSRESTQPFKDQYRNLLESSGASSRAAQSDAQSNSSRQGLTRPSSPSVLRDKSNESVSATNETNGAALPSSLPSESDSTAQTSADADSQLHKLQDKQLPTASDATGSRFRQLSAENSHDDYLLPVPDVGILALMQLVVITAPIANTPPNTLTTPPSASNELSSAWSLSRAKDDRTHTLVNEAMALNRTGDIAALAATASPATTIAMPSLTPSVQTENNIHTDGEQSNVMAQIRPLVGVDTPTDAEDSNAVPSIPKSMLDPSVYGSNEMSVIKQLRITTGNTADQTPLFSLAATNTELRQTVETVVSERRAADDEIIRAQQPLIETTAEDVRVTSLPHTEISALIVKPSTDHQASDGTADHAHGQLSLVANAASDAAPANSASTAYELVMATEDKATKKIGKSDPRTHEKQKGSIDFFVATAESAPSAKVTEGLSASPVVEQKSASVVPSSIVPATQTINEAFAALDASGAAKPAVSVHSTDTRHAEAGFRDPELGWVSVRAASSTTVGIHATVQPESELAARVLGAQLGGLNQFLHEQRTPVESLTMLSPGMNQQGASSHEQMQQQAGQQQSMPNSSASDTLSDLAPPKLATLQAMELIAPPLRVDQRISLLA